MEGTKGNGDDGMKFQIILSVIFFLILAIVGNLYFFKLSIMPFIGALLLALLVLGVAGNFFKKISNRKTGKGEPDAFIFPDKTAKKMKTLSLEIQYEASVLSSALLMVGIVIFLIYYVFFATSSWWMKGLLIFNCICGLGLMGGMMVTYYQQLVSYRESVKFLGDFAVNQNKPKQEDLYEQEQYTDDMYNQEPEPYDYTDKKEEYEDKW